MGHNAASTGRANVPAAVACTMMRLTGVGIAGGPRGRSCKRLGLGIDVGGTFTDIVVYDTASGRQASHKELTTHADPARGVMAGIDRLLARERHRRRRHRPRGARDDALHQRRDRAQGRADRAHHHQGLPRHAGDRARAQVRALRHQDRQAGAAGAAPLAPGGAGAHRPSTAACACPSTRAPCWRPRHDWRPRASRRWPSSSCIPTPTRATSGRRSSCIAAALSRPHAVGLHRRGARDPRVRARLDDRHQRLHQAAGRALSGRAGRPDRGARHRRAAAADAVERRPHQHRGGQAHAGAAAGIGPGGGRAGRRASRRRATAARTCWPSTWAAPPPSSASSTTASRRSPTASRWRASGASSRAAACRCASRPWS